VTLGLFLLIINSGMLGLVAWLFQGISRILAGIVRIAHHQHHGLDCFLAYRPARAGRNDRGARPRLAGEEAVERLSDRLLPHRRRRLSNKEGKLYLFVAIDKASEARLRKAGAKTVTGR